MSRALSRRQRGRAARRDARDPRAAHRPAYVERDDADLVPDRPETTPPDRPTARPADRPATRAGTRSAVRSTRRTTSVAQAPSRGTTLTTPRPARPAGATDITLTSAAPEAPEVTEPADPDLPALSAAAELSEEARRRPRSITERHRVLFVVAWTAVVLGGLALLVLALVGVGPTYLDDLGAATVLTAFTWALAARTGGRPFVFAGSAAMASAAVLLSGIDDLRTGAAVMTCCISATLAVVSTVPATHYARVAVECVWAVAVASVGALATLGFAPTVSLVRFEYAVLALSLLAAFGVVYRLGAGLHGLGRRGIVAVLVGGAVLLVTLVYAEALRRYGPPELVDGLLDVVRGSRDHLGAFPRPVEAVLGVPALAWGVHLRARRRQGWWVCAFGAAGTAAVASSLLNPAISLLECGLSVVYGLLIGLVIGYVVIRLDLALARTGSGGRRSEDRAAARPEPPRGASLL